MPYAAYDDFSIYGLGDSPELAIEDARRGSRDPASQFKTATISTPLFVWIMENGWNGNQRSFEVRNGEIFDTTED